MANDVKWIKLIVGMFDGESFKKIKKAEIGGVKFRDKLTAVWFELMEFAGRCNHNGAFINSREIPYVDLSDIATQIDREEEELKLCMQFYINEGMVTIIDDVFMLSNWSEYQNTDGMDKIREQTRKRVAKHRENQKLLLSNVTGNVTVTESNATDKDIDKDIDKKNIVPSKEDIASFFESIWKLYPNKKGKGQVSESKRKALYEIGFDEISRAVERYLKELKKDASWRQPQNGSTFFNSGYVDYLDANYSPTDDNEKSEKGQANERSGNDGTATGDNGKTLYGHYV